MCAPATCRAAYRNDHLFFFMSHNNNEGDFVSYIRSGLRIMYKEVVRHLWVSMLSIGYTLVITYILLSLEFKIIKKKINFFKKNYKEPIDNAYEVVLRYGHKEVAT